MSFTENDRNFRSESGKTFLDEAATSDATDFVGAVAHALRQEFGHQPAAVKSVARLVGANERAVRNWFEGKNGPNGGHLIDLMRHSDAVVDAMLRMCGRQKVRYGMALAEAGAKLRELIALIEDLTERRD